MKYLVIGNITKDTIRTKEKEIVAFGGTSSYASITAKKLGCNTFVLSRGNYELNEWIKNLENQGIKVKLEESEDISYFVNDYSGPERKQFWKSDAGIINFKDLGEMDIIHIGPVLKEITSEYVKEARKHTNLLSLDVQGFVREYEKKRVTMKFWEERAEFLEHVDLVKLNGSESGFVSKETNYKEVCKNLRGFGPEVVEVTLGENGSIVMGEEIHKIPAYQTNAVDKTGAGDVFLAASAVHYLETKDVLESGLFASAAASFVVEDFGTKNIKDKISVLERFRELKDNYEKSNNF
jgi:sugar/nucleoside kinase (ribokinase family)